METLFERAHLNRDSAIAKQAISAGIPELCRFWSRQFERFNPDIELLAYAGEMVGKSMTPDAVQSALTKWLKDQPKKGKALTVAGYFLCTFWNTSNNVDPELGRDLAFQLKDAQDEALQALIWSLGMAYMVLREGELAAQIKEVFSKMELQQHKLSLKSKDYLEAVLSA